MLEDSVGIPEYYKWRSRSGCYFIFFQCQGERLGLKRYHPELVEKAKEYENRKRTKFVWKGGVTDIAGYTWSSEGTKDELMAKDEAREKKQGLIAKPNMSTKRWQDVLRSEIEDDESEDQACLIWGL